MNLSHGNGNKAGGTPNLPGQPFDPQGKTPDIRGRIVAGLVAAAMVLGVFSVGKISRSREAVTPAAPIPTLAPTVGPGPMTSEEGGKAAPPSPVWTAAPSRTSKLVKVHVAGHVRNPGVIEIQSDARVEDAIDKAGGPTEDGDPDALSLAETVQDGSKILVPAKRTDESPAPGGVIPASRPAVNQVVNINTARLEELEALPGVGPKMAQKIVDYRELRGPFRSVDELVDVPGIGPKKVAEMRDLVVVN